MVRLRHVIKSWLSVKNNQYKIIIGDDYGTAFDTINIKQVQ